MCLSSNIHVVVAMMWLHNDTYAAFWCSHREISQENIVAVQLINLYCETEMFCSVDPCSYYMFCRETGLVFYRLKTEKMELYAAC